jgi:PIN domain nuclease of toxin-antitoxin system
MIVLDTHAWLWWVSDPSRLSRAANRRIKTATQIGISAISCLEVAAAVTKRRITLDREVLDWLEQALSLPKVELLPLTPLIAVKATQLGDDSPVIPPIASSLQLQLWNLLPSLRRIRGFTPVGQ